MWRTHNKHINGSHMALKTLGGIVIKGTIQLVDVDEQLSPGNLFKPGTKVDGKCRIRQKSRQALNACTRRSNSLRR